MSYILSQPHEFGLEDAAQGLPCIPEAYFTHPADCLEYAQAYRTVRDSRGARDVVAHYSAVELKAAWRHMRRYESARATLEQQLAAQIAANDAVLAGEVR